MREKVVPIPLLGRDVSRWVYRTSRTVREHPWRATAVVVTCAAASVLYEANVTHKDRVISPHVNNHLEYRLRRHDVHATTTTTMTTATDSIGATAATADDAVTTTAAAVMHDERQHGRRTQATAAGGAADDADAAAVKAADDAHQHHIEDAQRLLAQTHDPAQRAALQQIIEHERAEQQRLRGTAMVVRKGQLAVRAPYWDLRNNERNWSILARDQQQQKDSYAYRLERSRDDDFGRNTYSRN